MSLLPYEFSEKKVSPWGGVRMIHELYLKSGLREMIERVNFHLPGSNRGFDPVEVIEGFMVSVLLGARRMAHAEALRQDEIVREIFGWERQLPSQSTYSRFFRKYGMEDNDRIFPQLQKEWFAQMALDKHTIDLDSTVITRYGQQEGVEKGYNPQKHGRGSHHPLMCFSAELKMVVNAYMRSGDSTASTDMNLFLTEMIDILGKERIGMIRGDSGFSGDPVLTRLEKESLNYIVSARMTGGLVSRIFEQDSWLPLTDQEDAGLDCCSFEWQAQGWEKPRRMVVVRKDKDKHEKSGGKLLFPELEKFSRFKYVAFITNREDSAAMIWRLYNQRAECENRIKELKTEYGIDGFCLETMGATENAFRWVMVAHNLMALFRLTLLKDRKHVPRKSTINFQCIAIGSYLTRSARKTVLQLCVKDKRKEFIEGLFKNLSQFSPPFHFSNA